MTVNKNKVMTFGDTVDLIARTHKAAANPVAIAPHYDGTSGEYDNLEEWWSLNRDGKVYGVKIPEYTYSNDPTGIKTRDNVGLTIEPSTNTVAGKDDYCKLNAFKVVFCNGTVDDSGKFHCTAIEGDSVFARDGSNGDVWVMACNGYYQITRDGSYKTILYSDSPQTDFQTMPGGKYADGTRRPFLVFSPYVAWCDSTNVPHAYSGKHRTYQFGSHDTGVSYAKKKGTGYSGRTVADNFYIQMMMMLKYATQQTEKLGGCMSYSYSYSLASTETSVNRVCLTTAQAANFVVGSTVNVGTSNDRGQAANYSVAQNRIIEKIEAVSSTVSALYLSGDSFDTDTSLYVTTMPWVSGSCDKILGIDGYPVSGASVTKQPYRIQGIEFMVGVYEVLTDVICSQVKDSETAGRIELYKFFDCHDYASTVTNATKLDLELPARTDADDASWKYAEDWRESAMCPGFLVPTGKSATSTTGTCDALYSNPIASPGLRELLCFGYLWPGSHAGAFCGNSGSGLGIYGWYCGGRLSGLGVSAA